MIQYALLICYLYSINTTLCKGNSWITGGGGGGNHLKTFSYYNELCTEKWPFLPIFHQSIREQNSGVFFSDNWYDAFIKKNITFRMLRFHFFTATQGTWVHKDDRGPLCYKILTHTYVIRQYLEKECWRRTSFFEKLLLVKVCRQSRKTFLLLYCLFFLLFYYFISFPLSAFCDFSAIFHGISLIFGQLVDNNL